MLSEIGVTAGIKQQVQAAAVTDPGSKTLCRSTCKGDGASPLQQRKPLYWSLATKTTKWQQIKEERGAQRFMGAPQLGTDSENSAIRLNPKTGKSAIVMGAKNIQHFSNSFK